jgi:dihydrofolate reductase
MSGSVFLAVTMSLDGFIAQPDDSARSLHEWMFSGKTNAADELFLIPADQRNKDVLDETISRIGATIVGRRTFDLTGGWDGDPPIPSTYFVLTHRGPVDLPRGRSEFRYVDDGIEGAVSAAKAVAGDRDVSLMGASVAQQSLAAGLLDDMCISVVPVLLGQGVRLFETDVSELDLETIDVIDTPEVTHLKYRVAK